MDHESDASSTSESLVASTASSMTKQVNSDELNDSNNSNHGEDGANDEVSVDAPDHSNDQVVLSDQQCVRPDENIVDCESDKFTESSSLTMFRQASDSSGSANRFTSNQYVALMTTSQANMPPPSSSPVQCNSYRFSNSSLAVQHHSRQRHQTSVQREFQQAEVFDCTNRARVYDRSTERMSRNNECQSSDCQIATSSSNNNSLRQNNNHTAINNHSRSRSCERETHNNNSSNNNSVYEHEAVKHVELFGVRIVALTINGKDRLCLAQISNTLLKEFSYNEIHNRRVALGITCVQCTPIQLELLRRAGAMPSSSRRCGMITMREAERLCRSFLIEEQPPELPENFYFTVAHRVNYGCKGRFIPARYISSRAKCIECFYCGEFYSPNKFIFHSHKLPNTNDCNPPDSPNINSWRKHIDLDWQQEHSQEIKYAWEDVKSLFNGGTRRRAPPQPTMTTHASTTITTTGANNSGANKPSIQQQTNRQSSNQSVDSNDANNGNGNSNKSTESADQLIDVVELALDETEDDENFETLTDQQKRNTPIKVWHAQQHYPKASGGSSSGISLETSGKQQQLKEGSSLIVPLAAGPINSDTSFEKSSTKSASNSSIAPFPAANSSTKRHYNQASKRFPASQILTNGGAKNRRANSNARQFSQAEPSSSPCLQANTTNVAQQFPVSSEIFDSSSNAPTANQAVARQMAALAAAAAAAAAAVSTTKQSSPMSNLNPPQLLMPSSNQQQQHFLDQQHTSSIKQSISPVNLAHRLIGSISPSESNLTPGNKLNHSSPSSSSPAAAGPFPALHTSYTNDNNQPSSSFIYSQLYSQLLQQQRLSASHNIALDGSDSNSRANLAQNQIQILATNLQVSNGGNDSQQQFVGNSVSAHDQAQQLALRHQFWSSLLANIQCNAAAAAAAAATTTTTTNCSTTNALHPTSGVQQQQPAANYALSCGATETPLNHHQLQTNHDLAQQFDLRANSMNPLTSAQLYSTAAAMRMQQQQQKFNNGSTELVNNQHHHYNGDNSNNFSAGKQAQSIQQQQQPLTYPTSNI